MKYFTVSIRETNESGIPIIGKAGYFNWSNPFISNSDGAELKDKLDKVIRKEVDAVNASR